MLPWNRGSQAESPKDFWTHTGEKRGGEVGFVSFATFLGQSGDRSRGLPGLLYTVGDTVWFEDFERDNWLAKIIAPRQKYEKTELSFAISAVAFTRAVSRRRASACIGGFVSPDSLNPLGALGRLFLSPVLQIALESGPSLFMEVLMLKELRAILKK